MSTYRITDLHAFAGGNKYSASRANFGNDFSKMGRHGRSKQILNLRTMKWIQLAYCILVVEAVVAAVMAIVVRLTTSTGTWGHQPR